MHRTYGRPVISTFDITVTCSVVSLGKIDITLVLSDTQKFLFHRKYHHLGRVGKLVTNESVCMCERGVPDGEGVGVHGTLLTDVHGSDETKWFLKL